MAILAAEPDLFPEALFEEETYESSNFLGRRWWAIYTKAKQEKAVARQLYRYEVPFYLPLVPKDNLIRGRRVRSYLPVFPGYLFLYGNDDERVRSLTTNRISSILEVKDEASFVRDLRNVRHLISLNVPMTIESKIMPGERVRIKSGPMRDLEGIAIQRRGRSRLLVSVNFLQQGASVEIEDFQLEAI